MAPEFQEESGVDFLSSFGHDWPGPAVPGELTDHPDAVADRCAEQVIRGDNRLGLVAVDRGADALVVTGWMGPVNYFDQVSPLAAVVRSWEDRFGVRLLGIGFETLDLRLRVGFSASDYTAPDGSSLLRLDASSVLMAPDGYRRIVGMITGMIKAHPTENRMPRRALGYASYP